MEKGLIDIPGYEYLPAHEFASLWENRTVRRLNMKRYAYNRGLRPFIKRDEVEWHRSRTDGVR
jgi:hypothetical protein